MEVALVEQEVVVVVVSFLFKPSSLFSFDLHFVAFSSSSCCGGSGDDVEVVVVVADVVLVVVVVCSFPPLVSSSSSSSSFGTGLFSAAAAVAAVVAAVLVVVVVCSFPPLASSSSSSSSFGAGLFSAVTAAASLNVLHSLRCPPFFQCCSWHSRPQYCTVCHNLQGFNGRNGVLGLPQVEQQRMVGVVRPSCLSKI